MVKACINVPGACISYDKSVAIYNSHAVLCVGQIIHCHLLVLGTSSGHIDLNLFNADWPFEWRKIEEVMTLSSLQHEYILSIILPFLHPGGGWRKTAGATLPEYIATYFWKIV